MEDLRSVIDVDVESRMKETTYGPYKVEYENVLRKRQQSRTLLFDARNEVSADARYIASRIVTTMWIIGVGLPIVAALLLAMIK